MHKISFLKYGGFEILSSLSTQVFIQKHVDQVLIHGRHSASPEDISWPPDTFFFFMASILPVSQAMSEILGLIYWKGCNYFRMTSNALQKEHRG